jgi:alcohol dehydrogenase class IV
MLLYTLYCRAYQSALRIGAAFVHWREPERIEGPGSLRELPALIKREELSRVLIVAGPTTAKMAAMKALRADLEEIGIASFLYDRTVPNPTVANVEQARALYDVNGCDAIVAFGGGSPIDCAKAVGAMIARPGVPLRAMEGLLKVRNRLPPLIAIPTTAGTGSESTMAAVISDPALHEKFAINDFSLIPRFALLDPDLTLGLPPFLTATTGMDALTHAVEAFIGRANTKATEDAAIEATRLIVDNLVHVFRDGTDTEGRAKLLRASYRAGVAFTRAYVGYGHAIAHSLGGLYGTSHGLANAVILPVVLEAYGASAQRRLAILARSAGIAAVADSDSAATRSFIAAIRSMNTAMGIGSVIDGILESDIPLLVGRSLAEANPFYPVPRILSRSEMERIVRSIGSSTLSISAKGPRGG